MTESSLIPWEYAGIIFRVDSELSEPARDRACGILLAEYDRRRDEQGRSGVATGDVADKSDKPQEAFYRLGKVNPHLNHENVLEGRTGPVESTLVNFGGTEFDLNHLYESGYYRVPCRECGRGIKRTGKRGRAPNKHESCA